VGWALAPALATLSADHTRLRETALIATITEWAEGLFATEHIDVWVSGLTGAIGAILGSVVTIAWTEWFNVRSDARKTKERNSAAMFAALHRLNMIYSNAVRFRDHFTASIADAQNNGAPYLALQVRPMNRMTAPIEFPVDELWVLSQVGGDPLLEAVSALDTRYNAVAELAHSYPVERGSVLGRLTPTNMAGDVASVELTAEQMMSVAPGLAYLDSVITGIASLSTALVPDAFTALRELVYAKDSPFRLSFKIELPDPDGNAVEIRSVDSPHRQADPGYLG
jgi:hypothetical protein